MRGAATTLLAIAVLTTPAVLAGPGEPGGATAVLPAGWELGRAVVVPAEGPPVAMPLEELGDEQLSMAEALWLWSPVEAPRRFDRADLDTGWRPLLEDPPGPPAAALEVSLGRREREAAQRGRPTFVVAAPEAMWTEVPEGLLPTWRLPPEGLTLPRGAGEVWRVRVTAGEEGSWWTGVPADRQGLTVQTWPSRDLRVRVVTVQGEPVVGAYLTFLAGSHRHRETHLLTRSISDAGGEIRVPSLPDAEEVSLVLSASGHAPRGWSGLPSACPDLWRLQEGAVLQGRVLDPDGEPLPEVDLAVEGWLADDVNALVRRTAESGPDGAWRIGELPRRPLVLVARRDGYLPLRKEIPLPPMPAAAGERLDLVMQRAATAAVRVVSDLGDPVPGARVAAGAGAAVFTDREGLARLGLPAGRPGDVRVSADGYLPEELTLEPPYEGPRRIELRRAFRLEGRFVDGDGLPVVRGRVVLETGSSYRPAELQPGGRFQVDAQPGQDLRLVLTSPSTRQREVRVAPGAPGEVRDLGDLQAPPGAAVLGRVLRARDGVPVAGARIWTPRPSEGGPALAWMHGDLLETRSDDLGAFQLDGIPPGPVLLRVEAPGLARTHVTASVEEGVGAVDVGEVELSAGATVRVELAARDSEEPALALLDLRGEALPADVLTTRVEEGVGEIPGVPAGRALLEVKRGVRVLCRQPVVVEDGGEGEVVRVACAAERPVVAGQVWAGEGPAGAGVLQWSSGDEASVPVGIYNRVSRLGARQQQTFGYREGVVVVEVGVDGTFVTEELLPGEWTVLWRPEGGGAAEPKRVEVPAREQFRIDFHYPGGELAGWVRDTDGNPVERATVREVGGSLFALSEEAGRFRLAVQPGTYHLQARWRDLESDVVAVTVEDRGSPDPVELVVDRPEPSLEAQIVAPSGAPAAGALVFIESERGTRIVTADPDGWIQAVLPAPRPAAVRLAVVHEGRWLLGGWIDPTSLSEGPELVIPEGGGLLVEPLEAGGLLRIVGPEGWDLTRLLQRVGLQPLVEPAVPLTLSGLPPGQYRLGLGETEQVVRVSRGRVERVEM